MNCWWSYSTSSCDWLVHKQFQGLASLQTIVITAHNAPDHALVDRMTDYRWKFKLKKVDKEHESFREIVTSMIKIIGTMGTIMTMRTGLVMPLIKSPSCMSGKEIWGRHQATQRAFLCDQWVTVADANKSLWLLSATRVLLCTTLSGLWMQNIISISFSS